MKLHKLSYVAVLASVWVLVPQPAKAFYNPSTGRWLSRDPISEPARNNGRRKILADSADYLFVRNHPTVAIDSYGLIDYSTAVFYGIDYIAGSPGGSAGIEVDVYIVVTDRWNPILAWRNPPDGQMYWCHGFTFGGTVAPGGKFSPYSAFVPRILRDDGWQRTCCGMTQIGDIAVFYKNGLVQHSGKISHVSLSHYGESWAFDEANSTLDSKQDAFGALTLNQPFVLQAALWGQYRCYTKTLRQGCCPRPGRSEEEGQ